MTCSICNQRIATGYLIVFGDFDNDEFVPIEDIGAVCPACMDRLPIGQDTEDD